MSDIANQLGLSQSLNNYFSLGKVFIEVFFSMIETLQLIVNFIIDILSGS